MTQINFTKIRDLDRPAKIGEIYLVPCVYKEKYVGTKLKKWITPVIDHPHSDRENGQSEVHYHADFRFIKDIDTHPNHVWGLDMRPVGDLLKFEGKGIAHFLLPVVSEEFKNITDVSFIKKSKLKHKCIHKGKCPHRGYDLSQVRTGEDGVITCPLHGLRFRNSDKKLTK